MQHHRPPSPHCHHPYWLTFLFQSYAAKNRGIAWELTFKQWLRIWERSGRLHQRGRRQGQFCMGRKGDKGPYAVGNVMIIPIEENNSAAHKGKPLSLEHRRKLPGRTSEEVRASHAANPHMRAITSVTTKASWASPEGRAERIVGMKRAWAILTPEQRAARGRAISKGKRNGDKRIRVRHGRR